MMPSLSALALAEDPPDRKKRTPCRIHLRQGVIFMDETYDIVFEGVPVGTAQMQRQGLYCRFCCRCRLPDEGLYRIHAICGRTREDLGICVPMDGGFGMDKRIPAKRLGEGEMSFELVPKDWVSPAATAGEAGMEHTAVPQAAEPEKEETVEMPAPQQEELLPEPVEEQLAPEPAEEEHLPEPADEAVAPTPAEERFVPVSEDEPFPYLDQLEDAAYAQREGQPGILIRETMD